MKLSVTDLAHLLIAHLTDGSGLYIDATLGNGHDTLFLAGRLSDGGKVFAFDIAPEAFAKAKELLARGQIEQKNITWIEDSHENIAAYLQGEKIAAAMFNLGYLPGGARKYKTDGERTLRALKAILPHLQKGGVVTICAYVGHDEGEEDGQVEQFLNQLSVKTYEITKIGSVGRKLSPNLYLLIKTE